MGAMSIVMGIDQHRAQITAEWIELATGEIGRARVRPGDRAGVRRFLARFHLARVKPSLTPMRRGRLPDCCCRHAIRVDRLERLSGRDASPSGITPSNILSPTHRTTGSWTEVSPGARAQQLLALHPAHGPPGALDKPPPDK
jgi:hypothetical protein